MKTFIKSLIAVSTLSLAACGAPETIKPVQDNVVTWERSANTELPDLDKLLSGELVIAGDNKSRHYTKKCISYLRALEADNAEDLYRHLSGSAMIGYFASGLVNSEVTRGVPYDYDFSAFNNCSVMKNDPLMAKFKDDSEMFYEMSANAELFKARSNLNNAKDEIERLDVTVREIRQDKLEQALELIEEYSDLRQYVGNDDVTVLSAALIIEAKDGSFSTWSEEVTIGETTYDLTDRDQLFRFKANAKRVYRKAYGYLNGVKDLESEIKQQQIHLADAKIALEKIEKNG